MTCAAAMATLDPLTHCAGMGIELTSPQEPELLQSYSFLVFFFLFFCFFCLFRATPEAYGGSQAKGQIQATVSTYTAAAAMPDPLTHCARQGIEPLSQRSRDTTDSAAPQQNLTFF